MKKLTMLCMSALMLGAPAMLSAKSSETKTAIVLPTPKPGKGQVVFFRPGGMGSAIKCTVRENGQMVGRVGPNRYYVIDAEPGVHTYTAKSEATDAVTVQVEPDETAFVRCKIAMGMMVGRPNLSPATDLDFAGVKKVEPMDVAKIAAEIAEDKAKAPAAASGAQH
jgi:microcystin-dependent protein